MPTRNINLTDRLDEFVEESVTSGQYGNASEVVREALRLLAEQKKELRARIASLRQAGQAGFAEIDRGEGAEISSRRQLKAFVTRVTDESAKEAKAGKHRA